MIAVIEFASARSKIHLAVSKNSNPTKFNSNNWYITDFDSVIPKDGPESFNAAQYIAMEVDEEAVYITVAYIPFGSAVKAPPEIWVIAKGVDTTTGPYISNSTDSTTTARLH